MTTGNVFAAIAAGLLATACTAQQAEPPQQQRRPQQAGQPVDPLKTAGHMAAMRVASMTGNQQAARQNFNAMHQDLMRAMKLADASRPIDREAARGIARALPGVRSANWIDRHNLLLRVDSAGLRSQQTIDDLCIRLEPLGDTLAVVVHLQNAAARTHDDMDTLSRNCQLAPGDNAFMQRPRTVDALDPAIRAQQRAYREHAGAQPVQRQSAGDRAALEAMKEM